jgi:tetratricopeptide (TPR) repeat protein
LEEGSGDPIERAQVLDLKASLLRAQRRLREALACIKQVTTIYRTIGDRYREGRALISTALIHGYAGEPEKGIPLFFSALKLIDPQREPNLVLAAFNNLIVDLTELGRLEEAEALLPSVHACAKFGNDADRARIRWSEALLLAASGRVEEAAATLLKVRDEFIAQGIGYDTALVSLDLAKIYLGQGRISETRQLATEMHKIFVSREIHREALVALVFFQKAVEQERVTIRLVEDVAGYLKRAHGNPALLFERPT